jgi:hypothetical protein
VDVPVADTDVKVGAPGAEVPDITVIEIVAVLESVALVARMVKLVAESVTVGVPLMTPVAVEKESPVGSEEEILHELLATAPPEFVGVIDEIALFTVKVNVVGEIAMFGAANAAITSIEIVAVLESVALVARTV